MGISIWQLVIVLVIVLLLFGTKKLKNAGGDLGGAIRNFKSAMGNSKKDEDDPEKIDKAEGVIEGEVTHERDRDRA
jgi:sec-independent protein translocase protein TatA